MNKLSTSERIRHIKKQLKIKTNVKLGELSGAKKAVVGMWISGEIKSINPEYAFALEASTNFLAKWIMLGEGPETREKATSTHQDENIRTVIGLMEGTTEKTRIEICGIVRNYLINVDSKDETPQKIAGRTGTQ